MKKKKTIYTCGSSRLSFMGHSDLLCMVGMRSFYRQLSAGNFYSSEIVSTDCGLMKLLQLQLPFLSSNEPSVHDDVVPCLEMLIVK